MISIIWSVSVLGCESFGPEVSPAVVQHFGLQDGDSIGTDATSIRGQVDIHTVKAAIFLKQKSNILIFHMESDFNLLDITCCLWVPLLLHIPARLLSDMLDPLALNLFLLPFGRVVLWPPPFEMYFFTSWSHLENQIWKKRSEILEAYKLSPIRTKILPINIQFQGWCSHINKSGRKNDETWVVKAQSKLIWHKE